MFLSEALDVSLSKALDVSLFKALDVSEKLAVNSAELPHHEARCSRETSGM